MKTTLRSLIALGAVACAASAEAAMITTLTPSQINLNNTATASFTDGKLTLTPLIGNTGATFNANATRLGIDDQGTNPNSFNDPDTNPNNGNEERLRFQFATNYGLLSFSYDFARADGATPNDGVIISGFTKDPAVSFSLVNANLFAVYDPMAGSVRLNIPGSLFSGTVVKVSFDPTASLGQTLHLQVTDTDQSGAQLPIREIQHWIPEPSTMLLGVLGACLAVARRARRD
jgi:hypothetical protein